MADMTATAAPAADFAALMGKAAEQADAQAAEAPYGYTRTGQPKKSPGRPRKPPSIEELKGSGAPDADDEGGDVGGSGSPGPEPPADRAPDDSRRRARKPRVQAPVPPYKAGLIANGVNRLYRRAGKVVRAMDPDIGTAIIESARNTADPGEPDDSVGAAWDELAKTNPRIRRFLMKAIAGGAWGQLVMAHAPIGMAIIMKPAIFGKIPFQGLVTSMAEPDEDTPAGEGGLPGGMTAADAQQMADLAAQQMARMGMSVSPETAEQMAAMAQGMMGGPGLVPSGPPGPGEPPAAFARRQPRRPASRAKRHG
jgi:hypothetical protein